MYVVVIVIIGIFFLIASFATIGSDFSPVLFIAGVFLGMIGITGIAYSSSLPPDPSSVREFSTSAETSQIMASNPSIEQVADHGWSREFPMDRSVSLLYQNGAIRKALFNPTNRTLTIIK